MVTIYVVCILRPSCSLCATEAEDKEKRRCPECSTGPSKLTSGVVVKGSGEVGKGSGEGDIQLETDKLDLKKATVQALKAALKGAGMVQTGKRDNLVQRLLDYQSGQVDPTQMKKKRVTKKKKAEKRKHHIEAPTNKAGAVQYKAFNLAKKKKKAHEYMSETSDGGTDQESEKHGTRRRSHSRFSSPTKADGTGWEKSGCRRSYSWSSSSSANADNPGRERSQQWQGELQERNRDQDRSSSSTPPRPRESKHQRLSRPGVGGRGKGGNRPRSCLSPLTVTSWDEESQQCQGRTSTTAAPRRQLERREAWDRDRKVCSSRSPSMSRETDILQLRCS